jgi:hypothetical protein
MFKDEQELRWDSPPETIANRKWRMSEASPFSGNVAFVLYNCSSDEQVPYRVQLLHNEKPIVFPSCNEMYCPLEKLKTLFADSLKCDFKDMCGTGAATDKLSESEPAHSSQRTPTSGLLILTGLTSFAFGMVGAAIVSAFYWRSKVGNSSFWPTNNRGDKKYDLLHMRSDEESSDGEGNGNNSSADEDDS